MSHIVTASCNDCKYTDCCVVCPVECFYQDEMMLYIDPDDCIDCEACVPECPVEAIFAEANVPGPVGELHPAQRRAGRGPQGRRRRAHITEKQRRQGRAGVQEEVASVVEVVSRRS